MARKRGTQRDTAVDGIVKPDAVSQSPSITTLEDGTICVGDGCSVLRIPLTGNVRVDVSKCPDEVKKLLSKRIGEDGAATEYKQS